MHDRQSEYSIAWIFTGLLLFSFEVETNREGVLPDALEGLTELAAQRHDFVSAARLYDALDSMRPR